MTLGQQAIVYVVVSAAALSWQTSSLLRLLGRPAGRHPQRGLVRTAVCRVGASMTYLALGLIVLFTDELPALALIVFAAVQLLWMTNSWLDQRL